ncbi:hypothetical protein B0H13DRAFT_513603 [Mycena leptocephala]|nr:hypothetical protein B0H13DRAFT_513603 [Mycena leptocephala]
MGRGVCPIRHHRKLSVHARSSGAPACRPFPVPVDSVDDLFLFQPAHGLPVSQSAIITSRFLYPPAHPIRTLHGVYLIRAIRSIRTVRFLSRLCLVQVDPAIDLFPSIHTKHILPPLPRHPLIATRPSPNCRPRPSRVATPIFSAIFIICIGEIIDHQRKLASQFCTISRHSCIESDSPRDNSSRTGSPGAPSRTCDIPRALHESSCGTLIPPVSLDSIPFPTIFNADASPPRALFAALHARCPVCTQSHCRGCGVATGCEVGCCSDLARVASTALVHVPRPNPSPSAASYASPGPRNAYNAIYPPPPCPIPSHCPAARALGALAALIAFDRAHIAMGARDHGRAADKPLIGPLHALVFFLSPPPRAPSPPASGLLMLADDNPDDGDEDVPEAHAALPALLGLSRVPAYAAALLRVGAGTNAGVDVGTWMARAPAYGAVLRVLRAVGDAGCTSVLGRPVRGGRGPRPGSAVRERRCGGTMPGRDTAELNSSVGGREGGAVEAGWGDDVWPDGGEGACAVRWGVVFVTAGCARGGRGPVGSGRTPIGFSICDSAWGSSAREDRRVENGTFLSSLHTPLALRHFSLSSRLFVGSGSSLIALATRSSIRKNGHLPESLTIFMSISCMLLFIPEHRSIRPVFVRRFAQMGRCDGNLDARLLIVE